MFASVMELYGSSQTMEMPSILQTWREESMPPRILTVRSTATSNPLESIQLLEERKCASANLSPLSLLQRPKSALTREKTANVRLEETYSTATPMENSRTSSDLEESKTLTPSRKFLSEDPSNARTKSLEMLHQVSLRLASVTRQRSLFTSFHQRNGLLRSALTKEVTATAQPLFTTVNLAKTSLI